MKRLVGIRSMILKGRTRVSTSRLGTRKGRAGSRPPGDKRNVRKMNL